MGLSINGSFLLSKFNNTKAEQDRAERMQKRDSQVSALEDSIKELKKLHIDPQRKLELFHEKKDEIAGIEMAYNNEQMFHAMDEAMERAKKIAEEVKKYMPKTPEERIKDQIEEARGVEGDNGILSELTEQISDELAKEAMENLEEQMQDTTAAEDEVTGERIYYTSIDVKV